MFMLLGGTYLELKKSRVEILEKKKARNSEPRFIVSEDLEKC